MEHIPNNNVSYLEVLPGAPGEEDLCNMIVDDNKLSNNVLIEKNSSNSSSFSLLRQSKMVMMEGWVKVKFGS